MYLRPLKVMIRIFNQSNQYGDDGHLSRFFLMTQYSKFFIKILSKWLEKLLTEAELYLRYSFNFTKEN